MDTIKVLKKTHLKLTSPLPKIQYLNFSIIFIIFLFIGCGTPVTLFPRGKIPDEITKLCKQDYNLDVKTKLANNTVWVYMPLEHLLSDDQQMKKDVIEKLNNVSLNISRALLNTKNPPDFYVLVASDIQLGADYFLIGYVLDIKKYHLGFISKEDFTGRYIIGFELNPKAIGDKEGRHLEISNLSLSGFLSEQVAQRIESRFSQDDLKDNFKVVSIQTDFENKSFKFYINIKKTGGSKEQIDVIKEALKIFVFVIRSYDFNDFSDVEILDLASGRRINYGRLTLDEFKMNTPRAKARGFP